MGIDLTTFLLEVVNFLVLLWLLTRFLYRPVQKAIRQREEQQNEARQAIDRERTQLDVDRAALSTERAQLVAEREAKEGKLAGELSAERTQRLAKLDVEIAEERAKARARLAAVQAEEAHLRDAEASRRAESFLRAYLQRLAGPEIEQAIARLFVADLAALDPVQMQTLRREGADGAVEIATAYPPSDAMRQSVEFALQRSLDRQVGTHWLIDPAVIAGISVRLDGYVLEASLGRALAAFGAGTDRAT